MTAFLVAAVLICFSIAVWWCRVRLRPAELKAVAEDDNAANVFVLVHGTFASAAKWTTKDSNLVKTISSVDNGSSAVYAFVWWGRNSVRQRLYYANALANRLSDLRARHRQAGITIIAHSHGGAVSLKALEICDSACDIRLVCLSTPFLHVRERAPGLLKGASVFVRGTFLVGGVVACAPLATLADQYHSSTSNWVVSSALALVTLPLLGISLVWLSKKLIAAKGEQLDRDLSVQVSGHRRLLLIRMIGDEASAFLSAYTFFDWLLEWMLSLWHTIDDRARKRQHSIWEAILGFTLLAALVFFLANRLRITDEQGVVFLAVGVFAGPLLALLSFLFALILPVACVLPMGLSALLEFGPGPSLLNLLQLVRGGWSCFNLRTMKAVSCTVSPTKQPSALSEFASGANLRVRNL